MWIFGTVWDILEDPYEDDRSVVARAYLYETVGHFARPRLGYIVLRIVLYHVTHEPHPIECHIARAVEANTSL